MKEIWFAIEREGIFYWVKRDDRIISSVSSTFLPAFGFKLADGESRQFALVTDDTP